MTDSTTLVPPWAVGVMPEVFPDTQAFTPWQEVSEAKLRLLMRLFPEAEHIHVIGWMKRRQRVGEYTSTRYIGTIDEGMELVISVDDL